jgi:hypothetical protein
MGAANESSLLFAFPDSKCKWRLSPRLEQQSSRPARLDDTDSSPGEQAEHLEPEQ